MLPPMKHKIIYILSAVFLGLLITVASATFNRKENFREATYRSQGHTGVAPESDYPSPCDELNQVRKGFPLAYILVKPSVSICNSVEPVAVLWLGNAYHEEYPLYFVADVIFWSCLSGLGIYVFYRVRHHPRDTLTK